MLVEGSIAPSNGILLTTCKIKDSAFRFLRIVVVFDIAIIWANNMNGGILLA